MGVVRTHRPVVDKNLCRRCGVCVGACPARVDPDFGRDVKTVRGSVYYSLFPADEKILPPCTGACPLGQKVRDYVSLLHKGAVKEALLAIRQDNPLPGICAFVCHHPCETACVRGALDEPVSIRELKRYAVQRETRHREEILSFLESRKAPTTGKRVVVIGAGPAGLACAHDLLLGGCDVEVLDALDRPGGMAAGGIPQFRLPRGVIEHDAGMIQALGAVFTLGVRVGKDLAFNEVQAKADAVVVAVGAWKDMPLGIPGEGLPGVEPCLDFLGRVNLMKHENLTGRVLVIGGGNAAVDAARSALRAGAEDVAIVYRRGREDMPADPAEVVAALCEGVSLRTLEAPVRVLSERGEVRGLELVKTRLTSRDESGRRRPEAVEGSVFFSEADRLITAVGQRPEAGFLGAPALSPVGTVSCDASGRARGYENVFAAGDAVSGPSTVVEAAASGRRAAGLVLRYLQEAGREK